MGKYIQFGLLLTPFATENRKLTDGRTYVGVTRYYIFGILVAEIQKTVPW